MVVVGITLLLLAALAVNHFLHGYGCWGLQPGGRFSARVYELQILTVLIGEIWLLVALRRRSLPFSPLQILAISFFTALSIWLYIRFGHRAFTSGHYQGAENLIAYLFLAATSYLVGRYSQLHKVSSVRASRGAS